VLYWALWRGFSILRRQWTYTTSPCCIELCEGVSVYLEDNKHTLLVRVVLSFVKGFQYT